MRVSADSYIVIIASFASGGSALLCCVLVLLGNPACDLTSKQWEIKLGWNLRSDTLHSSDDVGQWDSTHRVLPFWLNPRDVSSMSATSALHGGTDTASHGFNQTGWC